MNKYEIGLEELIAFYAAKNGKDGIFLSIIEYNENLARLLDIDPSEFSSYVDTYMYVSDFSSKKEREEFWEAIQEQSEEHAQYMLLVENGEIKQECP